ncbi:MAG TPA: nucleotide sugar dehydrogenase [Acidimicrobiales bacterium]|jgi:UDP-N-acetyl-D-mannosaminuronic acid dehydrogenase
MSTADHQQPTGHEVAVVGLGYVGLTIAVALADAGVRVLGYDVNTRLTAALRRGEFPFYEPGIPEAHATLPPGRFDIVDELPDVLPPAVIVCVGTPVDDTTHQPELRYLHAALDTLVPRLTDETLVILRSTVPVGTSRTVVLPRLASRVERPLLAFSPERTIQGKALRELRELPQVIGALDERSLARAKELLGRLNRNQTAVSSLEAAEMVKLICNCHTDLIYGFGNEVALMAESLGLDADEVIAAANHDYPRPDLNRPGFVGGSCLVKDPYLLMRSTERGGYFPPLVSAARRLNEQVPYHVADRVMRALKANERVDEARVLICGLAYKGWPVTDDVRGAPSVPIIEALRDHVGEIVAHDHMVGAERAAGMGVRLVGLEEGFAGADAALVLINHPGYRDADIERLIATMRRPAVVFDAWGIYKDRLASKAGELTYLRLGRG